MAVAADLRYRVAIVGSPSRPDVPWTADTLARLATMGFNTVQLNIAWGSRPADEPLNLEDLFTSLGSAAGLADDGHGPDTRPEALARRRSDLAARIDLCRSAGMRSIFHFGAPYNGQLGYHDQPLAQCVLDPATEGRYVELLGRLAAEFPGIDDLLLYTYDQDAWLCNEFGTCNRCRGMPLHRRVVPLVNRLAAAWRRVSSSGRLWWEPWELSAGQVLASIDGLDRESVGLAVHSNVAEVMVALPVDRYVRNAARRAAQRGIPVILEGFLGAMSEEVEPFRALSHPLATVRQLRAMVGVEGIAGVKEYYGLDPWGDDPNLRVTALFFSDPAISDAAALARLGADFGPARHAVEQYWRTTSEAIELYPWDASWFAREVGRSEPDHALTKAFIRGQQAHTPSWESTRRAIFMKTDDLEPDPWLLEDVQLRCGLAADALSEALAIAEELLPELPLARQAAFVEGVGEVRALRRRMLAYAYHLRETNLTTTMRACRRDGVPIPASVTSELVATLRLDAANHDDAERVEAALEALALDVDAFLDTFFVVPEPRPAPNGPFSMTSR
ncbi:MAG: hypothetical protein M3Q38_04355 [Chloroflexota bacterium]|nr:hypothetical protein [Chloroflexota bacterium]